VFQGWPFAERARCEHASECEREAVEAIDRHALVRTALTGGGNTIAMQHDDEHTRAKQDAAREPPKRPRSMTGGVENLAGDGWKRWAYGKPMVHKRSRAMISRDRTDRRPETQKFAAPVLPGRAG